MLSFLSQRVGASFVLLVTLLAWCGSGCHRPGREAVLLVSSEIGGTTAPCGCTSRPLGGLDRIAAQIEAARRQGPAAWVVLGNTYFLDGAPSPAMRGHSATTGRTIATIVDKLAPIGVAPGPNDRGPAAHAFAELAPPVRARLALDAAKPGAPVQIRRHKLGRAQIAVLQVEAAASATAVADASAAAQSARQDGAEGVVLLWPLGRDAARRTLAELQHVDVVLCGSDGAPAAPEPLGDGMLLDAGARGEHLGALQIVHGTPGRWQYYDGGAGLVAQLESRRKRLQAESERLPPGPGRDARLARAQALAEQAKAAVTAPPASTYFAWRIVDIDEDLPKASWATDALDAYNQSLCASARQDTAQRTCAAPERPEARYVGSATCQACHPAAWAVYEKTAHARAWATLTVAHKACDLSCVGCHVVGWEAPGGFCHLEDAEQWANVGCESCHGPGKGHVEHPERREAWGPQFVTKTAEATCRGCHNAEHSDQFDFASYRPRILGPGHGLPLAEEIVP